MSHHQSPPPTLGSVMQSVLTGRLDHGSLLDLPILHHRSFWIGAALGAAGVLFLKAQGGSSSPTAAAAADPGPEAAAHPTSQPNEGT